MAQTLLQFDLPSHAGEKKRIGNLTGASLALAISMAVKHHPGPLLVVTPDTLTAQQLQQEIHFFQPDLPIRQLPDWEILPYDHFSPHQDIISQRLLTLYQLPRMRQGIVLVPIHTLMHYAAPASFLEQSSFVLAKGEQLDLAIFRQRLTNNGYRVVNQVIEHGEFAIRGSIIDLFPMGSNTPFRIDLFDDDVDSIRTFDVESQRSLNTIEKISLLPAHEYPLDKTGIANFRQRWREHFSGNPIDCPIYQRISAGESAPGIEYYLPLFFNQLATLFDYLAPNSLLVSVTDLQEKTQQFWQEINERYEQLRHDRTKPLLAPQQICLLPEQLFQQFKQFPQLIVDHQSFPEKAANTNLTITPLPDLAINHQLADPLMKVKTFLSQHDKAVVFCTESQGRREVLNELLHKADIHANYAATWGELIKTALQPNTISITTAPLANGFELPTMQLAFITESELFGQEVLQKRLRKRRYQDTESIVRNLTELKIGDPVVHIDHGIGRYKGLTSLATAERESEYVIIEYEGNDKLYVPVASLHLISRYTGGNLDHAPLNRLGSKQWEKAKRKAKEKIRDVAAELLDIYAKRAAKQGYAFKTPDADFYKFAQQFPFEETPDQEQSIDSVIKDMTSPKAMDRLICGDVGFGKTEVAMRAAFLAVQSDKQVAVLVPTTLLAEQHEHNFTDRFAQWPIKIAAVSRFRTAKEQENIIQQLQDGLIDIIVGTHKLLQSTIKFKDLGLLIIDEEHRFGVQQKEKIKALRANVDILTLTATPIPRTLNMSLVNIRDLSIIATPPIRRLSVKTFISEYNKGLVREAILREILRGGQVYYLHNDVATIERQAEALQELVPDEKINIAHGQMRERQLENIMSDFYHQRFHILVCTTIIESGIDVPSANTIIIHRADRFGIAQLHQLRGRVGRSHHQAYAYLITPAKKSMTRDARKRLEAFSSLDALGAGFILATHDLEIRGAGELLGEEQSGHIEAIGFSLFMELLEQTVDALKSGKQPDTEQPFAHSTEIDLHVPALIPEDYVHDVHTRLTLYKRIASAKDNSELTELQVELTDRFGLLPPQTKNLFAVTTLKLQATQLDIKKIDVNNNIGRIEFNTNPNINVKELINLIQTQPAHYKLEGSSKLQFKINNPVLDNKIAQLNTIFQHISI